MGALLATCLTVGMINFLGLILPGPDFVLVTRNALISRKAGLYTSFGITCGVIFHLMVVFFFLDAIQDYFPNFLDVISYFGAFYLFFMAFQLFRSFLKGEDSIQTMTNYQDIKKRKRLNSLMRYFWHGLFTNLFNVKCYLFYVSILSQYFDPNMDPILVPILMGIILTSCLTWFSSVTYLISAEAFRHRFAKFQKKLDGLLALALTFFAIKILM